MGHDQETIVAEATPFGTGGIGIVRLSGKLVPEIAQKFLGNIPAPRYATLTNFLRQDNSSIDHGIAIYFPAPNSFTGEEVLELHAHGGRIVIDALIQRALELGARLAQPGEFSFRAFLNNKIDLIQAEAIADLINATTLLAANNAMHSLQGEFSKQIHLLVELLTKLRIYIEAAIDFPEETKDFLEEGKVAVELKAILHKLSEVEHVAEQGVIAQEGINIVIVGKPNAGKSSLLNNFSGQDTAIVTDIPGTTRDILRVLIQLDGMPMHILDTAGLRDNPDVIEREGIKRAFLEIKKADHVLIVVDAQKETSRDGAFYAEPFVARLPQHAKITIVFNKIDLTNEPSGVVTQNSISCVYLSTKTKDGLDLLKKHLRSSAGLLQHAEGFSARRRHLVALHHAKKVLEEAYTTLQKTSLELVAENLVLGQKFLSEITGEITSENLLERIFSEFCLGK